MNIVFRCDASNQIGTGHVMRCLTLADELSQQGVKCHFICREHEGNLHKFITEKGHIVYSLPVKPNTKNGLNESDLFHAHWLGATQEEDAQQTIEIVKPLNPEWIIVDHYALDKIWESKLQDHCKAILVIDDLADRYHNCDMLVDQNYLPDYQCRYNHLVSDKVLKLLGPNYTLIRKEFLELREERTELNYKKPMILINFGGIGRFSLLSLIIETINPIYDFNYHIIAGKLSSLDFARLSALITNSNIKLDIYTKDLAQLMKESQFCIGACGSSVWERFCLGLNSALVEVADNQHYLITYLESQSLIDNLGSIDCLTMEHLTDFISRLDIEDYKYKDRQARIMEIVDGLGAKRLTKNIFNVMESM